MTLSQHKDEHMQSHMCVFNINGPFNGPFWCQKCFTLTNADVKHAEMQTAPPWLSGLTHLTTQSSRRSAWASVMSPSPERRVSASAITPQITLHTRTLLLIRSSQTWVLLMCVLYMRVSVYLNEQGWEPTAADKTLYWRRSRGSVLWCGLLRTQTHHSDWPTRNAQDFSERFRLINCLRTYEKMYKNMSALYSKYVCPV